MAKARVAKEPSKVHMVGSPPHVQPADAKTTLIPMVHGDFMPELCTYHVGACRRQGYYYDRQNQKVYADGKIKATAREKAFAAEIVEEVNRGRSTSRSKSKRSRSPEGSPSRGERSRGALESDDDENIEDRNWRRVRSRSTTAKPEKSRLFQPSRFLGLFAKRQQ